MKQNILLSICIPTFNRCELLIQSMEALVNQVSQFDINDIEIIVSDNNSIDQTSQAIQSIIRDNSKINIRHYRQEENIGAVRNNYFLLQSAVGDFIYLVSDDDIFLPGSLKKILTIIRLYPELDAICPGINTFVDSVEEIKTSPLLQKDERVNDKNKVIVKLGTMITFISSVVFRRNILTDKNLKNFENLFPQSFIFLDVIARQNGCFFLMQPCLGMRVNVSIVYDLVKVFVDDFNELLIYAYNLEYSRQAIRTITEGHSKWLAGAIYHFKKSSYKPNIQKRLKDTIKVFSVWWTYPVIVLRIVLAIWLPDYHNNSLSKYIWVQKIII